MVLANVELHYPDAREWMWNYCMYLGPYTDSEGENYDLGIFVNDHDDISAAIVHGNEPGDYFSGSISFMGRDDERYIETKRRAIELGLMKK